MTQIGPSNFDPIPIGEVAKPPFARLPDPLTMFARRAIALAALAQDHRLETYRLLVQAGPEGMPAGEVAAVLVCRQTHLRSISTGCGRPIS